MYDSVALYNKLTECSKSPSSAYLYKLHKLLAVQNFLEKFTDSYHEYLYINNLPNFLGAEYWTLLLFQMILNIWYAFNIFFTVSRKWCGIWPSTQ